MTDPTPTPKTPPQLDPGLVQQRIDASAAANAAVDVPDPDAT